MSGHFSHARKLYERAQVRLAEFNRRRQSPPPWNISTRLDHASGEYIYRLTLNRQAFEDLELIAADLANDLAHALDHVVAVWARIKGPGRVKIYYPAMKGEADFAAALVRLKKALPPEAIATIQRIRQEQRSVLDHVDLIKKVSGLGKHWNLVATDHSAHAVGFAHADQREIAQVPEGHFLTHDTFDFARTKTPPPVQVGYDVLTGMRFSGLDTEIVVDPSTAFQCASRFVLAVIVASEASVAQRIA